MGSESSRALDRKREKRRIEVFLENATREMMEGHTDGDPMFRKIRKYCASDYTMAKIPGADNLEGSLRSIAESKRRYPRWEVNPYNISPTVSEKLDHAIVWFTSAGSVGLGVNRESVSRTYWRKRAVDQGWECYKHESIRGGGNMWEDDELPLRHSRASLLNRASREQEQQ